MISTMTDASDCILSTELVGLQLVTDVASVLCLPFTVASPPKLVGSVRWILNNRFGRTDVRPVHPRLYLCKWVAITDKIQLI